MNTLEVSSYCLQGILQPGHNHANKINQKYSFFKIMILIEEEIFHLSDKMIKCSLSTQRIL